MCLHRNLSNTIFFSHPLVIFNITFMDISHMNQILCQYNDIPAPPRRPASPFKVQTWQLIGCNPNEAIMVRAREAW